MVNKIKASYTIIFALLASIFFFAGQHYGVYRIKQLLSIKTVECEVVLNPYNNEQHVIKSKVTIDYKKILVADFGKF